MVVTNTVSMAVVHYKMDEEIRVVLRQLNYIFSFVFNMEMVLKLISLKGEYF